MPDRKDLGITLLNYADSWYKKALDDGNSSAINKRADVHLYMHELLSEEASTY